MKRYIDTNKCDGCNGNFLCVNDCVTSFLEIYEDETEKNVRFKIRGYCIDCGHCNAICPNGAIITENDSLTIDDNLLKLFSMKRTIRNYNKSNEIKKSELELIIRAGQSSPTEKNRGTIRICFVKENLNKIFLIAIETLKTHVEKIGPIHPQYQYIMNLYASKEPIFWGAEYAVVIIGKPDFAVDAAIAAERMQLEAYVHEIASGYNGNLKFAINNNETLKEIIGIKNQEEALVCFVMGNTDIRYHNPYISEKKKIIFL